MFPPLLFDSQFADFVAVCHTVSHSITHFYETAVVGQASVFCICHVRVCLTFIFSLRQAVVAVTSCLFCQASLSPSAAASLSSAAIFLLVLSCLPFSLHNISS